MAIEQAEIYLDNNATTPPLPEVRAAMVEALDGRFGNASSVHARGGIAREQIRAARAELAALLGVSPSQLIFTSSGTEANNTVLASCLQGLDRPPRLVTSAIEHSSIQAHADFLEDRGAANVRTLPTRDGLIRAANVRTALDQGADLVSIQWVNNETGVIQPVEEIAELCRERNVPFHTDAAQAVGKIPIRLEGLPIDYLTLTAHKLHGPPGIGAIYAADPKTLAPLMHGGDQEGGLRAGTENLAGIVGLGAASRLRAERFEESHEHLQSLRDQFEEAIKEAVPGTVVNGGGAPRVPNTSNLRFPEIDGQALVARLDKEGIRCSQSSACTNQRPEPSYVLRAMGLTEDEAYASVRFSFSVLNTLDEIDRAVEVIARICGQLQAFHSLQTNSPPKIAEVS